MAISPQASKTPYSNGSFTDSVPANSFPELSWTQPEIPHFCGNHLIAAVGKFANQLSASSLRRLFSAIGWAVVFVCVPLAFMRLEGRRPAIGLYYFTGTLLVASGLCTWIVSGFHRHLVRLQWRIFAVSIIMYGATYLISATEILGFIPIVDSVFTMNMLSSASLAAGLLSVTACGGETTAWMRLLDTFTAEIVCWMFFLAIHSNDATGFSKYHLLFSVFALAFTAAIALAATQGATSRAESLFAACATVYFSARAITAFVINIVAYYWLQTKGETLFNLLFPVPSLASALP